MVIHPPSDLEVQQAWVKAWVKDPFRKALDREMVKAWIKAWVKAVQNVY